MPFGTSAAAEHRGRASGNPTAATMGGMKAAVDVAQLSSDAPQCVMAADQPALERLATRLRARGAQGLPSGRERERFEALLAQSTARVEQRRSSIPALRYTEDLPVVRERATIEAAIRAHQGVLVCGDTGSGKGDRRSVG